VKPVLFRLFTVVFALAAGFVVAEIAMRMLSAEPGFHARKAKYFDRGPNFYHPEPARLHPWAAEHPDPLRIAVIGDSITAGASVNPLDTYPRQLERLLNMNDSVRPAQVDVYAAGGTTASQQLRFLEQALGKAPDVVLLGICLNDAEDANRAEEYRGWRAEAVMREPEGISGFLAAHSRAYHWVYEKSEMLRSRRKTIAYYRKLYEPSYSGFRALRDALQRFDAECEKQDAPFIAFIFPNVGDPLTEKQYSFHFAHEAIGGILTEMEIPHFDLWPAYRGMNPVRMQVIPGVDGHLSEIAHRVAADAIFRYLLFRGVIDPVYVPNGMQGDRKFWNSVRAQTLN
jgi:lysophospholipase L1-like esterase